MHSLWIAFLPLSPVTFGEGERGTCVAKGEGVIAYGKGVIAYGEGVIAYGESERTDHSRLRRTIGNPLDCF